MIFKCFNWVFFPYSKFQFYFKIDFFFAICDFRVIFSAKEGEFAYLVRGGEDAVFVKSKEDTTSRRDKL